MTCLFIGQSKFNLESVLRVENSNFLFKIPIVAIKKTKKFDPNEVESLNYSKQGVKQLFKIVDIQLKYNIDLSEWIKKFSIHIPNDQENETFF